MKSLCTELGLLVRGSVRFPHRVRPKLKKLVFATSLLNIQHNVENKLVSLLIVTLGKAINGMPLPLSG